jgi:hypothetical protein
MPRLPRSLRCVLAATALALSGCGGPQPVATAPDTAYGKWCQKVHAEHDKDVHELVYLRPDFKALQWPVGGADADGMVHEASVFDALRAGQVHWLYVQARGGIGKTELSKAIAAATCGEMPAYRVDLRGIYGPTAPALAPGARNPIEAALASQAPGLDNTADLLGQDRSIVTLDAIEEVASARRAEAMQSITDLRTRHPKAQVVLLGRPSIFEKNYGIKDFDSVLELPPLDCGRARSSLARLSDDEADRKRILGFVATWNLDRQSLVGQQCYFPYLATYRDIGVVQRLAKTFNPDTEMGGLQATLSQVHESILAERLLKELTDLQMTADQALQAVDAMVALGGYENGEWNLTFTVPRCLQSQPGGDTPRNRAVCEKLFQSVLFERIVGTGAGQDAAGAQWKFGFQDIADLFVARWLEAQLLKTPGQCTAVTQQAEMVAGKTIAGYLVGRPGGARCLQPVAKALCKDGGFNKTKVALLYKGLPLGPTRAGFVQQAKEAESKQGADACTTQLLGAL